MMRGSHRFLLSLMSFPFRLAWPGLLLASVALLAGCMSSAMNDPARNTAVFRPANISRDPTLGGIRRVVLMPIDGGSVAPEESAVALDPVFREALQDQNRFEVVTMSRAECNRWFGKRALSSAEALPHDFMATLRRIYGADAVMFVDLTVFHPYHPLALGVRAKLAAINNAHVVWAFDNVFAASDPAVAAGARRYYHEEEHQDVPVDLSSAMLESPARFGAYVAQTTFATLPPVTLARLTDSSGSPR